MGDRQNVRDYFTRTAAEYGERRYGGGGGRWREAFFADRLRVAADLIGPRPGRVLDLGSGPGVLSGALGAAGGGVVRVDLSPAMLGQAPGPAAAGDAEAIPLRAGSVDTVVALGLTTYLRGIDRLLRECRRVLADGGRLVLTVTRRTAPDTLARGLFRLAAGGLRSGAGLLTSGLPIRTFSDREAPAALRRAGFEVLAVRGHNRTVFPLCYLLPRPSLALGRRLPDAFASDLVILAAKRAAPPPPPPAPVVRVIARLNVGGPARQAILLSRRLDPARFPTTLVTGIVADGEGDMLPAARQAGVDPVVLPDLGRRISPFSDLRAFLRLLAILRRTRPAIVHTHTAKAGTLGRLAACLAGVPVRVHTFHGHVLHGYFGVLGSALVRAAERVLARLTTRVVAVSLEVARDLIRRHRVVPPGRRCEFVALGLDLAPLLEVDGPRGAFRASLGLPPDVPLVGIVGRVTAVKEPRVALAVARRVLVARPDARFVFVGGGDLLAGTRAAAKAEGLAERVLFAGFRDDLPEVFADTDVALLTSRNEGTPVALIEAAAAGVPAVATRVGGVPFVVEDGRTGMLAAAGDVEGLAAGVLTYLADPARRRTDGAAARACVRERFAAERLLADVADLYGRCIRERRGA